MTAIEITSEKLAESGSEEGNQKALFCWSRNPEVRKLYPELKWLFAIPNGGFRHKVVAANLRAQGVTRGVPDICLAVKRGSWSALWIELKLPKREDGRRATDARKEQSEWIDHLKQQGMGAIVCRGWEEARKMILAYLHFENIGNGENE